MRRSTLAIGPAFLLFTAAIARAGFEPNTYVYTSKAQEETSTHVLVGIIREIRPLKSDPITSPAEGRRTLNHYLAELDVTKVEKGQGVQPGDVAYIHFHSPKTSEEVEYPPFLAFGCSSLVNYQAAPAPGNRARVYVNRTNELQYVADYPQSFFPITFSRISKRKREESKPGSFQFIQRHPWPTSLAIVAVGFLLVLFVGKRRGRTKTSRRGPSDPAFMWPLPDEIPFDESWRERIEQRSAEIESGSVKHASWDDVRRRAREATGG